MSLRVFQVLPGQAHVHRPELAEGALFAVAVAEVDPAVGNRGFAADRLPGRPGKALLGRFAEGVPGEAEDRRSGDEAKKSGKHGLSANFDGDTIAAAAWRRPNKIGWILSIGARRPRQNSLTLTARRRLCGRGGLRRASTICFAGPLSIERGHARRWPGDERGRARCRSKRPAPSRNRTSGWGSRASRRSAWCSATSARARSTRSRPCSTTPAPHPDPRGHARRACR